MGGSATNAGHYDQNQNASLIGVIGTLGTADQQGTALTLPYGIDPTTGAMYTIELGTASGGGGSNVNIITGTQQVAGTITGGTVQNLASGTVTISNPITSVLGTIVGSAADGATTPGNPVFVGGTTSLGSVHGILVSASGIQAIQVNSGTLTTGTLSALASGTITGGTLGNLNNGTLTLVSTVSNLTNGSINILGGTIQNLVSGTLNAGTVTLTDGTQLANTLAGDAGQNGLLQAGIRKEASFAIGAAQAVVATDVSNYSWVSVQITQAGTMTFQASNDNSNWFPTALEPLNATSQGGQTTLTGTSILQGPLGARYFRLNVTGPIAGTTAGVVEFFATPRTTTTTGASVSQSGAWNVTGTVAAGTLTNLATGTITALAAGTITGGTIQNLVGGTINALAAGTLTGGTLQNLVSGTINSGTFVNNGGSVQIYQGTLQQNMVPVVAGTSYGTVGTTAAAVWGTLIAAAGAGTKQYVSGVDVVVVSGTVEVAVTNSGVGGSTGAGVLTRGNFPPGGGIAKSFNPVQVSGANGTLAYWLGGAGTVDVTIQYWQGV
jgi:hypothetical protein